MYRTEAGARTSSTEPFSPVVLIADPEHLRGFKSEVDVVPLAGTGTFRWMARVPSWTDALRVRDLLRDAGAGAYFPGDAVHQHLLLSGRTSFRGLVFPDLRRLALDIEVATGAGFEFPHPSRPSDRIVAISLADSDGFRHVLRGDHLGEAEMLRECTRLIRERDPDVLEGHNIFRFDLEYLDARAAMAGVPLPWGRGGEVLRGHASRVQVADRSIPYRRYHLAGRHIVDTWLLAQLYDLGTRDLPSFGLKDVARHFGVAAPDRTYVDPGAITQLFRDDPDRLFAYALDDALETLAISALLSPPYFAQAQLLPFDYESTVVRGNATKIDALIAREYLHRGRALPVPGATSSVGGGHTAVLQQGVARPVLHVDVTSLYPSIMLSAGIAPQADELRVFSSLLRDLRQRRVDAKRRALDARDTGERLHFTALQQSLKILINSFYGYLGFSPGHWNDFEAANRVTAEGRRVVATIVERLAAAGAIVIEVDTDGVYFVPPADAQVPGGESRLLEGVTAALPDGIQLELAGRYAAMFSYKMKNYALLDERGRLTVKGSALRSRGLEPYQRVIVEALLRLLLDGRGAEAPSLIERWTGDFIAHRVPVRLFAKTDTLQDALEQYRADRAAGLRSPAAAYELALRGGREYQAGDQVSYYVAGRRADVAVHDWAKLAASWDAAAPDENTEYYVAKVQELWRRFRPFVELGGLRPYVDEPDVDPDLPVQLVLF